MNSSGHGTQTYVCDLKLVLLGESSVGKSSIVMRYTTGNFQKSNATIGAAYTTKTIETRGNDGSIKRINLEIWDTAGQERYRSLAPMYYRNTDIALIVFDVTKPESLRRAHSWIEELNSYVEHDRRDKINIFLVANKKDLEHDSTIMKEEFVEVSAKTGEGIDDLFNTLILEIPDEKFERAENTTARRGVTLNQPNGRDPGNGCNC